MAEHVNDTTAGGGRPREDSTTMPGQYPSKLPFGFPVPQSTGSPGGGGTPNKSPDPTIETLPSNVFGSANPMTTGSPGSSGAGMSPQSGATYTDPFAQVGTNDSSCSGGSVSTEAQSNKTGYPTPIGTPNVLSTGAGQGTPLIGGRGGKNRGR
jgi:hypothetical protein